MATKLIVNLAPGSTTMISSKATLSSVCGVIEAADGMLLLWDKDQITSHSPALLNIDGGTTQATALTVPIDLAIEAGTVIKNVSGKTLALIFS